MEPAGAPGSWVRVVGAAPGLAACQLTRRMGGVLHFVTLVCGFTKKGLCNLD